MPSKLHLEKSTATCHGNGERSFESDEELENELSAELRRKVDPGQVQRAASKMNLIWTIEKV